LPPSSPPLLPELAQPQLSPQLAPQPVVAKRPRPPQLHLLQLYLHAIQRVGRQRPVLGQQAQARGPLFGFVKDLQRLAPRRLLAIVDLSQIQNSPLHHPARTQPPTLLHAPIAVLLAVFDSLIRTQVHGGIVPSFPRHEKGVGLHYKPLRRTSDEDSGVTTTSTPNFARNGSELRKSG